MRICWISGHCQIRGTQLTSTIWKEVLCLQRWAHFHITVCHLYGGSKVANAILINSILINDKENHDRYILSCSWIRTFPHFVLKGIHTSPLFLQLRVSERETKRKKSEAVLINRSVLFIGVLFSVDISERNYVVVFAREAETTMPVVTLRDTSMSAINVGAAGSRTRLTREPSAKQMQRDQCQGCASSSSSRMLLRLLQVRCNKSRKPQRANSFSQVHGT